jgi:hypothetical protein
MVAYTYNPSSQEAEGRRIARRIGLSSDFLSQEKKKNDWSYWLDLIFSPFSFAILAKLA